MQFGLGLIKIIVPSIFWAALLGAVQHGRTEMDMDYIVIGAAAGAFLGCVNAILSKTLKGSFSRRRCFWDVIVTGGIFWLLAWSLRYPAPACAAAIFIGGVIGFLKEWLRASASQY